MSAEVRQVLSDAASTVLGIECTPYYRQTTQAGQASVRYGQTVYPNRLGGIVTWEVVVPLPQDVAAAEAYIDEKAAELRAALAPEITIRRTYPATATFGGNQTNVLVIEGTREED